MQILINISKEQYSLIMQSHRAGVVRFIEKEALIYAIKNGVPLPKGHGALIDENELWDAYHKNLGTNFYEALDIVNPIIEADEEVEE